MALLVDIFPVVAALSDIVDVDFTPASSTGAIGGAADDVVPAIEPDDRDDDKLCRVDTEGFTDDETVS